jgi:hypothetical protein
MDELPHRCKTAYVFFGCWAGHWFGLGQCAGKEKFSSVEVHSQENLVLNSLESPILMADDDIKGTPGKVSAWAKAAVVVASSAVAIWGIIIPLIRGSKSQPETHDSGTVVIDTPKSKPPIISANSQNKQVVDTVKPKLLFQDPGITISDAEVTQITSTCPEKNASISVYYDATNENDTKFGNLVIEQLKDLGYSPKFHATKLDYKVLMNSINFTLEEYDDKDGSFGVVLQPYAVEIHYKKNL